MGKNDTYQSTNKRGKTKNVSKKKFQKKMSKLKNPDLSTSSTTGRKVWSGSSGRTVSTTKENYQNARMKKGGKVPKTKSNYNGWDIQPS